MREIKFRIWDSENMENPKMQYCDEICICDNGLFFEISKFDLAENHNDTKNPEIMQFTGLKDKNGKEIYEGDIINITETIINEEIQYGSGPVSFVRFCYFINDMFLQDVIDEDLTVEIIGNIYENPELVSTSNSN